MSGAKTGKEKPGDAGEDIEETVLLTVPSWKRTLSRWRRSFSRGWRLYKQSKAGLIGLGIIMGFVFTAVFAPWIAPYDIDFLAPQEDVFKADNWGETISPNASLGLDDPASEFWYPPFGYSVAGTLEEIVIYSNGGHSVRFMIDVRALPDGGTGIDIVGNTTYAIPENVTNMFPVNFRRDEFAVYADLKIYELNHDTMTVRTDIDIPFEPIWFSNVWNRWSTTNNLGEFLHCYANETALGLYARIPPNQMVGEVREKRFIKSVDLADFNETNGSLIIGEPIMLNVPFMQGQPSTVNGSLMVVPTTRGVVAFYLNISVSLGIVTDVSIEAPIWSVTYEEIGNHFERTVQPISTGRPISIAKEDPSEALGKERIILATESPFIYSISRINGSLEWSATLATTSLRDPRPIGIWPTFRGDLVVTGVTGELGFIASVDRNSGDILGNRTWFNLTGSPIIGRPGYVPASRNYIFMTENQQVVILKHTMQLDATFKAVGTGTETTIVFVGNMFQIDSVQGNYYSMVTRDGVIWVQSVTGTYLAPLKPGVYPSGNRYILGTDVFGGDIFTQLVYATRTELIVGLVAAVISAGLGTLVGLIAGFYGGWVDTLLMRLTDIFLTLPILVVALLLAAVLGPSIGNIILIIAIFSWAGVARVIRAQTLSLKNRSFIDAARVSGASNRAIILRHLGPNVLPLTFLYMVFTISGAIITEAILAFLGMGDPTAVTWGMMLQFLQISGNTLTAWWWLLPPGIAITLLSLAFYMMGRAFDEVVNPRLRAR